MNCQNPKTVCPDGQEYVVPCGKCLACLVNARNDWSLRLYHEWRASKGALFVTLTYHPKFVPDDGLNKRHVQLFIKRLRKNYGQKIRYYLVGEYGSKTGRPHYHALLFNVFDDEEVIRKSWTYKGTEIGIVHIGKVTEASIKYTTKYIIQRSGNYERRKKPFALMSRAYGLGAKYLTDEMVSWHRRNDANYSMYYDVKVRLPRFYKDKIWWRYKKAVRSEFPGLFTFVEHPERRKVMEKAKADRVEAEKRNYDILKKKGYIPELIIAEMRSAVLSRVIEKTAFTQII